MTAPSETPVAPATTTTFVAVVLGILGAFAIWPIKAVR